MAIVALSHPYITGIDTHARKLIYTIAATSTGRVVGTKDFPITVAGTNRALAWGARCTEPDAGTLWENRRCGFRRCNPHRASGISRLVIR